MQFRHVNHLGIVVDDLEAVKAFFIDLGFTEQGDMPVQGEWVERIIGLKDVHEDISMIDAPDGQFSIELVKFHSPVDPEGLRPIASNTFGLRHIAFEVDDIDKLVSELKKKGTELVGEIQTYENIWKLCYVRGPEGIIIELAERLGEG